MLTSPDKVSTGPCLCHSLLKMSKWFSLTYSVGTFQSVAFVLDLRENRFIHKPLTSRISVTYSSDSPSLNSPDFQNQMFGGGHLSSDSP